MLDLEARPAAFAALQTLDAEGLLKFDLRTVAEELLALFCRSQSLTTAGKLVQAIYQACPSDGPRSREGQQPLSAFLTISKIC